MPKLMDDTVKGKPQQIRTFSPSIVTRQIRDHIIWDPFKEHYCTCIN